MKEDAGLLSMGRSFKMPGGGVLEDTPPSMLARDKLLCVIP